MCSCHIWLSVALGLNLKDTSRLLKNCCSIVGRGRAQGSRFTDMRELNIEDFFLFFIFFNYDRMVLRGGKMKKLKTSYDPLNTAWSQFNNQYCIKICGFRLLLTLQQLLFEYFRIVALAIAFPVRLKECAKITSAATKTTLPEKYSSLGNVEENSTKAIQNSNSSFRSGIHWS